MSLRWKIALALGVLTALATMAVGIASYRSTSDRLYAEVDRSLTQAVTLLPVNRRGELTGLPVRGPLSFYDAQLIDGSGEVRLTTFEAVVPPSDDALSHVGDPASTSVETVDVLGADYRVRTVGLANGAIQVARPLSEIERVLDSLRTRTMIVVLLVAAAGTAVGFLIAGRVTRSLRRLTEAASTVEATGRLDVEVPSTGHDEVGTLAIAFERMLGALSRSRADQQRLVQDAGHELRTPLTSLRTNLDVLRRHPDLPADQRSQVVDDLHAETEELVELVNEVIAVASGGADDEPVRRFSLGEAAREVAERYERRTDRPVVVDVDESPVVAQHAAVQRAISNLLDNARKFDTSGAPIEVHVRNGRLVVLDRGPGIRDEERDLVFERFHRSVEARTLPGSGLGLSIVRDVVERQGGSVAADDREGGGAAVGFTLPLAPPWQAPAAPAVPPQAAD